MPPASQNGSFSDVALHPWARPSRQRQGGGDLKQLLTAKEAEAIVWVLSELIDMADWPTIEPATPRAILSDSGYSAPAAKIDAQKLETMVFDREIVDPLTDLQRLILKTCVENSTWITQYRSGEQTAHSPTLINEALATLRSLAAKLEAFGIEVSHIPFD